jgi:spore coat polysaccharide biosynthesis predicted glycosyltransferase SpsG
MTFHVVLRCDGGPGIGVGHVVRCLAVGEELVARGHRVSLIGHVSDVPWLEAQLAEAGIPVLAPSGSVAGLVQQVHDLDADAVALDGYDLPAPLGRALRDSSLAVLAFVDGNFGAEQSADVYVDQNLGAASQEEHGRAVNLLGLDYVVFRDSVLRHRPPGPVHDESSPTANTTSRRSDGDRVPRVLAVFGGTDAFAAGPTIVPVVLATGDPVHVIAVGANPELTEQIATAPTGPGQVVEVIRPTPDLAAVAVTCDVAVTAAGTSIWELMCLGVPTAVVCVVDNQRVGYDAVVAQGVASGLGMLETLRRDPGARSRAVAILQRLLNDPVEQAERAKRGMALIDGKGRTRVADALIAAVVARRKADTPSVSAPPVGTIEGPGDR